MNQVQAKKIISDMCRGYDQIAEHFAETREKVWSDVSLFLPYVQPQNLVLDIGCGSGRLYSFLQKKDIRYLGADQSKNIIAIAKEQWADAIANWNAGFTVTDITELIFDSNSFDVVFALAVVHHVPSAVLQLKAMKELYRVTKKGGKLLMTNWNLYADIWKSKYGLTHLEIGNTLPGLDKGDCLIPWKTKNGKKVFDRFVHAFLLDELIALCTSARFRIERAEYILDGKVSTPKKGANLFIVAKK